MGVRCPAPRPSLRTVAKLSTSAFQSVERSLLVLLVAAADGRRLSILMSLSERGSGLLVVILFLLGIDLYRHRGAHAPSPREALTESIIWVTCGLAFSAVIAIAFGGDAFGEYISGYLIEKSLSVDNVFVWSMLFAILSIPLKYQHRVLFWGILGALTLRAIFILLGTALIGRFWWVLLVFGVFLVYTGAEIIRHRADEGQSAATRGLSLVRRIMPVTDQLDGQRFFTELNGRRATTPLLAALFVVEVTDIIFAVDSVPAILAVQTSPTSYSPRTPSPSWVYERCTTCAPTPKNDSTTSHSPSSSPYSSPPSSSACAAPRNLVSRRPD